MFRRSRRLVIHIVAQKCASSSLQASLQLVARRVKGGFGFCHLKPELLEVYLDVRRVRIQRENSFALSCELAGAQSVPSLLGAEQCWWDGHQLHFRVLLPDGLLIKHRFVRSADGLSLSQRTALTAPGVARDMEVVKIFSRYDLGERGYRCTETLTRGRVCTTEQATPYE